MKSAFALCSWKLSAWCGFHWKICLLRAFGILKLDTVFTLMNPSVNNYGLVPKKKRSRASYNWHCLTKHSNGLHPAIGQQYWITTTTKNHRQLVSPITPLRPGRACLSDQSYTCIKARGRAKLHNTHKWFFSTLASQYKLKESPGNSTYGKKTPLLSSHKTPYKNKKVSSIPPQPSP